MVSRVVLLFVLVGLVLTQTVFPAQWNYDRNSPQGPSNWKTLFPLCGSPIQSPINIDSVKASPKPYPEDITWQYEISAFNFNRTTVVGQFQRASSTFISKIIFTENGVKTPFILDGVRVHSFSEHQIDGKTFPVEFEFFHTSLVSGNPLIISVLAVIGRENSAFAAISRDPLHANWASFLPADKSYFEYVGSYSAPPCNSGVKRLVLAWPVELSESQVFNGVRAMYDMNSLTSRPIFNFSGSIYWNLDTTATWTSNASHPQAISMFRQSLEGWYQEPLSTANIAWSGENGRYAIAKDNATTNAVKYPDTLHYFSAPAGFRGNLSHLYNGALSFEIRPCVTNESLFINYTDGDVIIRGYRKELVASFPYTPNPYFLTRYTFNLAEAPSAMMSVYTSDTACTAGGLPTTKIYAKSCTLHEGSYYMVNIKDDLRASIDVGCDSSCGNCLSSGLEIVNSQCMVIPTVSPVPKFFIKLSWDSNTLPHSWWRVRNETTKVWGTPATQADVKEVLSYVKCVNIRSRFTNNSHITLFENAILADGTGPLLYASCPGSTMAPFTMCSGNGVCVNGFCKCNFGWSGPDCNTKVRCVNNRKFPLPRTVPNWRPQTPDLIQPEFFD